MAKPRGPLPLALIGLAFLLAAEVLWTTQRERRLDQAASALAAEELRAEALAAERSLLLSRLETAAEALGVAMGGAEPDAAEAARRGVLTALTALEQALAAPGAGEPAPPPEVPREVALLRGQVELLVALSLGGGDATREFLATTLRPQTQDRLALALERQRQASQDTFTVRRRQLERQHRLSRWVSWTLEGLTWLAALALGFHLLRSTRRQMAELKAAARAVGEGQLETRVRLAGSGELASFAGTFNEMAAQLHRSTISRSTFDHVLESMPGALFRLDSELRILRANEAAVELVGVSAKALLGKPLLDLCQLTGLGAADLIDLAPGTALRAEGTVHRPGGRQAVAAFSFAGLTGRVGAAEGLVVVAHDVTERKQAEQELRGLLAEKDLLLREVHHRVKNNLQVVSSLLDLQAGASAGPAERDLLAESRNRIRCMALLHEQLYRTTGAGQVDLDRYFRELTTALATSQTGRGARVDLDVTIEDLGLGLDQAVPLGLIVNELVTNSFKHAFAPDQPGTLRLELRRGQDGQGVLTVADNGRGFEPARGASNTLGLTLVEALTSQLGGSLTIDGTAGATTQITFPIAVEPPARGE